MNQSRFASEKLIPLATLKPAWQQALADLVTDPEELFSLLLLDKSLLPKAYEAVKLFPLRATRSYLSRIRPGDIDDPLLRQILPLEAELQLNADFVTDPLNEAQYNILPGLLHKYSSRVLLTPTASCAIHCRYCFRRHFPYEDNNPGRSGWSKALDYIAADHTIHEVILSGGDPLMMNDKHLEEFIERLEMIPHLQRLRFHSRLPIVLPERITDSFIETLSKSRLQMIMVVHCNHANELDDNVAQAATRMQQANITLLNQTVLLKGVNDNLAVLTNLSEQLFKFGILPYYLHLLDKVSGTTHFEVDELIAKELYQALCAQLSGYLVPKLVREQPGQPAKTRL